ncbi:MAG: hypothetical protein AAGI13_00470 [Pseudomonadota bacterium]
MAATEDDDSAAPADEEVATFLAENSELVEAFDADLRTETSGSKSLIGQTDGDVTGDESKTGAKQEDLPPSADPTEEDQDVIAATLAMMSAPESDPSATEIEIASDISDSADAPGVLAPASEDQDTAQESGNPDTIAPLGIKSADLEAAVSLLRSRGAERPQAFQRDAEMHNIEVSSKDLPDTNDDVTFDAADSVEDAEDRPAPFAPVDEAETVDRILAKTDDVLNEEGAQSRRSALSHIKAAVAATFADRLMPGKRKRAQEVEADASEAANKFSDLGDADDGSAQDAADPDAAPASSEADLEATTDDAEDQTTAPLVLVPQARVDWDDVDPGVKPRRITRTAIAGQDKTRALDTGFANYAESVGASELHELLEAAAAYLSVVEGKAHFSRPEVMHMVMRHDHDRAFSREDSLRSFGDLLRNGTIEKIERGQFVISTDSRFVANG